MSWVTLFDEDSTPDAPVRRLVEQWCQDNRVEFVFKAADHRARAEYNVHAVPTLRYFDPVTSLPRTEAQGLREVVAFLDTRPGPVRSGRLDE